MSFLSSAFNSIRSFYGEINSATLTGAIDVVVVEQKDGSYLSSPFHVRFGKLGVLKAREKIVHIEINGESVDINMKLDDAGTAFFVEELNEEECPEYLATSPIPNTSEMISFSEDKVKKPEPKVEVLPTTTTTKSKKKRKSRPKHSRSGSKTSLREINPDIFEMDGLDGDVDDSDEDITAPGLAGNDKELGEELTKASPSRGSLTSINLAEIDNSFLGSRIPRSISENENFEANLNNRQGPTIKESSSVKADYHYFSEPDDKQVASKTSKTPKRSRSPGGILSDSEYETSKKKPAEDDMTASWRWGELPSTSTPTSAPSGGTQHGESKKKPLQQRGEEDDAKCKAAAEEEEAKKDPKKWSIFNYLRASRKDGRSSQEGGGVYLDDINDEEMLALYVGGASRKYEDAESGNGPSLPMSPHPAGHSEESYISLSLCGYDESTFSPALFEQYVVSFDDFMLRRRDLFGDTNLIVKMDECYYKWSEALPSLMCRVFYKRSLPSEFMPKCIPLPTVTEPEINPVTVVEEEEENIKVVMSEEVQEPPAVDPTDEPLKVQEEPEEANKPQEEACTEEPIVHDDDKDDDTNAAGKEGPESNEEAPHSQPGSRKKSWWSWYSSKSAQQSSTDKVTSGKTLETLEEVSEKLSSEVVKKKRSLNALSGNSSDSSNASWNEKVGCGVPSSHGAFIRGKERFRKTLRLSSDDVKRLNLRDGSNEAEFTVTTPYQGTSYCKCHIYLWKHTDKVVISDIDGTITKSDVLGHIFPIIGRDWAQSGVAQLFSKIRQNGYQIIYLSARAIGQASITKEYLQSIKQGDLCLPDGPLLLNPTSLIYAFHREVIEKKPEEFKISCLRDIQKLFEDTKNPFYAGYGNRINDSYAYRAVGIPVSRIFTINYRGELKHDLTQTFQTSYCNQSTIVDHLFPPRTDEHDSPTSGQEYCSFTYWREPLCEIELPLSDSPSASK